MSASRTPYRQSTGSRRRESHQPFIALEKTRTPGRSADEELPANEELQAHEELPVHHGRHHMAPPRRSIVRVKPSGESGRSGFHPFKFLKIIWKSSSRASLLCNIFWPVVPAAFIVRCKLSTRVLIMGTCRTHLRCPQTLAQTIMS